jgi:hypothetical protein
MILSSRRYGKYVQKEEMREGSKKADFSETMHQGLEP